MEQNTKDRIGKIINEIILALWALSILIPLVWVLIVSFKTNNEFFMDPWAFPKKFMISNYTKALEKLELGQAFLNTIYFVFGGLFVGISVTSICSYILGRLEFKGKKFIWGLIMASLFLPGINILVPQYTLALKFGLNNSLTGLIVLINLAISAFDVVLLSGFMKSIPKELEESAYMDGATLFTTFIKIILPLSTPGIVTISIFRFLNLYNDFINPFIYLTDAKKHTVAVSMFYANKMMQFSSDWVTLFAAIILTIIPSLLTYILFQKQIMEGATLGAVKG